MQTPSLPLLFAATLSLLAPALVGQMRGALPGIPITPPPVDHPALAAQPLIGNETSRAAERKRRAGGKAPAPAPKPAKPAEPPPDESTSGPKLMGPDLKKAVAKVKTLKWHDSLDEARAHSAATGKPILWLQALGDLEGFA